MSTAVTQSTVDQERESLKAQIEALKAKNLELLKQERAQFRLQVSSKGGISVYGMGRFPVTLYREQMERFLAHAEDIKAFIKANESSLKTKPAPTIVK